MRHAGQCSRRCFGEYPVHYPEHSLSPKRSTHQYPSVPKRSTRQHPSVPKYSTGCYPSVVLTSTLRCLSAVLASTQGARTTH